MGVELKEPTSTARSSGLTNAYIAPDTRSHCNPTVDTLHQLIRDVCVDNRIGPLPELPIVGEVRCPGTEKPPSNRACWIKVKHDCAHIFDHSSGFTTTVYVGSHLTAVDRNNYKKEHATISREEKIKRELAVIDCGKAWHESEQCQSTDYTKRKKIKPHGCRWHSRYECLLVPMYNISNQLRSVQRIYDNGVKRYWPGTKTTGLFFPIGKIDPTSTVLICEGFATGATLHQVTDKPVVCAMTSNNLLTVAESIRYKFGDISITICGDDDRQTKGNPGRAKATETARAIGARLALPKLCDGCMCTDWNDSHNCTWGAS